MKTNLSNCCNAEVKLIDSIEGSFYLCLKCGIKHNDLASPEVIEKEDTPHWRNTYPISTFSGETRIELVLFIENLLSTQEKEAKKKRIDMLDEIHARLNEMATLEEIKGKTKFIVKLDEVLYYILELINKNNK